MLNHVIRRVVPDRSLCLSAVSLVSGAVWRGRSFVTMSSYTVNSIKRWSCADNVPPGIESIKTLHIYDFDNTLFATPLPNRQLWQGSTIGMLQSRDTFATGGWWHDANILKSTGEGLDKEEPRGWEGWWNEQIVKLVELTMQQKDALSVLLTGRSENGFADIIQRIVKSRKLEFDLVVLRPKVGPANQAFPNTMNFKQSFIEDLIYTYREADELRIYEDRPKHVNGFREFFIPLNQKLSSEAAPVQRKAIHAEVIEVPENDRNLDPVKECAEVQRMINSHNNALRNGSLPQDAKPLEMKKQIYYTGYLLSPPDTQRLLQLANLPSSNAQMSDIRTMANNIIIVPRPCPQHILDKIGGMGKKFRWRAVALGNYENKVWAARVEPVSNNRYYSENQTPMIVLATRGNSKPAEANRIQSWQSLSDDQVFEFDTVVGEKALLRVEEERLPPSANNGTGFKRNRADEEEFPPLGPSSQSSGNYSKPFTKPQDGQRRSFHQDHGGRPNGNASGPGGAGRGRSGQKFDGRGGGQRFDNRGGRSGGGTGGASGGSQQRGSQRGRAAADSGGGNTGGGGAGGRGRTRGGYPGYKSLDDDATYQAGKRNAYGMDGSNDGGGLTY